MPHRSHLSSAGRGLADDLMRLAAEKSSTKRLELLRRVTDVYLKRKYKSSAAGEYLFNDLISEILNKISAGDRALASAQLSTRDDVPDFLAHRLATDEDFAVAAPMLRNYQGLTENTLLTVARSGSHKHRHSIARRLVVTPPVSEAVVDHGNQITVRTLAANQGAQFSPTGMRKLIAKSETDVDLQSLIVERADLTLEAVGILLPLISQVLAARLRVRASEIDQAALNAHFEDWMRTRSKNIARNEAYIEGIRAGNLTLENVAMETINAGHLFDVAAVLAAMNDLDRDYAFDLLSRGNVESVLLLLRSMGLSWTAVEGFLKLRRAKMTALHIHRLPERADYELIDLATAQRVMRFLKVRCAAMTQAAAAAAAG